MKKLVLLRHGESVWNRENRFTGWIDVGLSDKGTAEALEAGRVLAREGFGFDVAFTSVLKRAIKTLWLALGASIMVGLAAAVFPVWRAATIRIAEGLRGIG